jgi:zinc/manganese transport system permease protein
MDSILHAIVEPGFFTDSAVQLAIVIGGIVALVTAGAGMFTVIRRQAFAGDALGDIGATGGSSAYLAGISPLWGFLGIAVISAIVMELIGVQRARGRDVATGIVLGAGFGLAALFLYLGTSYNSTTGAAVTILFGSIFTLRSSDLPLVLVLGSIVIITLGTLYRPLLLCSANGDLARAKGLPVRLIGAVYLIATAVAVALSADTIGAILSTALLIGPAASALRIEARPGRALLTAAILGLGCTWLGILLAWDSFYWPPIHHGWPASFFIVTLVLIVYLLSGLRGPRFRRGAAPAPVLGETMLGTPSEAVTERA